MSISRDRPQPGRRHVVALTVVALGTLAIVVGVVMATTSPPHRSATPSTADGGNAGLPAATTVQVAGGASGPAAIGSAAGPGPQGSAQPAAGSGRGSGAGARAPAAPGGQKAIGTAGAGTTGGGTTQGASAGAATATTEAGPAPPPEPVAVAPAPPPSNAPLPAPAPGTTFAGHGQRVAARCGDGTTWTGTTKAGACSGHGPVTAWVTTR
jgi:hypothetical protein